jgi:histidinol-phosphate aminotransferase
MEKHEKRGGKPLIRHSVDGLSPYLTDKPDKRTVSARLCFNENLHGPSPGAVKAIVQSALSVHFYPDPGGWELREALQGKHGIPPEQIILANGADGLITLISATFLNPGDEVIFCEPTFPIYKSSTLISMGIPKGIPLDDAYRFNLESLKRTINEKTKLIYLCNPNNPTGTILPPAEIEAFLSEIPEGILVVFDEAYVDFMDPERIPPTLTWIEKGYPIISLRTFSKAYGLAGMRIGYAMASEEVIQYLYRVREPFVVATLAIKAAVGALSDTQHYQRVVSSIKEERDRLQTELGKRDLTVIPSQANFIFVELGETAEEICERLKDYGVLIRFSSSWQMPRWARVTVGTPQANQVFLRALDTVLSDMSR